MLTATGSVSLIFLIGSHVTMNIVAGRISGISSVISGIMHVSLKFDLCGTPFIRVDHLSMETA